MLLDATEFDSADISADIAIVGAGPSGITLALELAKSHLDVLLIESGQLGFSDDCQNLGEASYFDPQFHAAMAECTRRQLGGTSTIWGGRCVPYDPVDFALRNYIPESCWPLTYEDISPYFQRACDYFLCGKAEFNLKSHPEISQKSIVPGLSDDDEVINTTIERWCLPTNFGKEYFQELKDSKHIKVLYGLTCTEIEAAESANHISNLKAKTLNGLLFRIKASCYVLAGGALNTTRLLLNSDSKQPGGIGNHSGMLGHYYMGHLSGDIAAVKFTTPPQKTIYGFDRDSEGVYLRRRFSFTPKFQQDKELTNIVAWLGTPRFEDPSHQNGIYSLAYLMLSSPLGKYLAAKPIRNSFIGEDDKNTYKAHFNNILRDVIKTSAFAPKFAYQRYIARRKIPALFVHSAANEYSLHYHAEQVPNRDSRVTLSHETDALGMRRLNINLRYSAQDVDSVIRAHQYWDDYLRRHNCGYLKYLKDDLESSIWEQAKDGFHQVGATRMSANSNDGVVTQNCNVHGFDNLYVASSSVFVTSSQANSTFMILAFALRLAEHLKLTMKQG